jgi:hypothetical protein
MAIDLTAPEQFLVGSNVFHAAAFQDHDGVGFHQRREPM